MNKDYYIYLAVAAIAGLLTGLILINNQASKEIERNLIRWMQEQ